MATINPKGGYASSFFQKITTSNAAFGATNSPDAVVNIVGGCQNFSLSNETASSVVEISFNGNTVAEELDSTLSTKFVQYTNRPITCIWIRVKSGGPCTVAIRAW